MEKNLQYGNEVCNIEKSGMQYGSVVCVIGMKLQTGMRFVVWE